MRYLLAINILFFIGCKSGSNLARTGGTSDFSGLRSYAFLPAPDDTLLFNDDIVEFRSIQQVKKELDIRGFTLEKTQPDFFVRIQPFFKYLQQDDDYPSGETNFSPRERHAPGIDLYFNGKLAYDPAGIPSIGYAEGTILVEFIDAANGSLLWSGWLDQPVNPSALPEELEEYFGRLFEAFPVKTR